MIGISACIPVFDELKHRKKRQSLIDRYKKDRVWFWQQRVPTAQQLSRTERWTSALKLKCHIDINKTNYIRHNKNMLAARRYGTLLKNTPCP